jgi:hypothetical protein
VHPQKIMGKGVVIHITHDTEHSSHLYVLLACLDLAPLAKLLHEFAEHRGR